MQYNVISAGATPASRAILFFNGWAMTPESVEHLALPTACDLFILWDYRSLLWPDALDLSGYDEVLLAAWSMGVWAADRVVPTLGLPIVQATAICGTGLPMSDHWGIPEQIFRGTLEGLTDANRMRFNRRMCGGRTYRHLFDALARRTTEEIRQELEAVLHSEQTQRQTPPLPNTAPWTHALIGGEDRIIPADNQQHYWKAQGVPIRYEAEAAHYLLGQYTSWTQLWQ